MNLYLSQVPQPIQCKSNNILYKGVSEDFFREHLVKRFNTLVADENSTIILRDNTQPSQLLYAPDFVLTCMWSLLVFAIEIDEPYSASGMPIHYIGSNDEKKNNFFTENGWIVIRFTEQQIIENTDSCLDFIDELMYDLQFGYHAIQLSDPYYCINALKQ